ncbi:MAG: hypothetical protein ACP5OE_08815 [Thermodesulfobium sp.]
MEWTRFLKKRDYEIEYGEYGDWDNVMFAVKDCERIPVCILLKDGSIIKHSEITVSQKNFDILRTLELETEFVLATMQVPEYPISFRIVSQNGKYTLKEIT